MTDEIRTALQLFADYYDNKTPDEVTLERVHEQARKALATPLEDGLARLQAAYEEFRREAQEAAKDPKWRKACLEDAATVANAIGDIENGLNRGKHDDEHLEAIFKGEV